MPKPPASRQLIQDLVAASRILAAHEVLDAYGHVSARSDRRPDRFLMSRSRAPARRRCSIVWCPRWMPSKLPTVSATAGSTASELPWVISMKRQD